MIVNEELLPQLYSAIKEDKFNSDVKNVMVFVSTADTDSLAALSIFGAICSSDELHFSMHPVSSYEEIQKICQREIDPEAEDYRTIVFINCGATRDVRDLVDCRPQTVRFVIIDAHRPVHYAYNTAEDTKDVYVVLADDDPVPAGEIPVYDEELEAEISDSDSDEDSEAESQASQRRRLNDGRRQSQREARDLYADEVTRYQLRGSGYGKPSAMIVYDLAHRLRYHTNQRLWLAICGLTDQLVQARCDRNDYMRWTAQLEGHVAELGNNGVSELAEDDHENGTTSYRKPMEQMRISAADDYWFSLHRHWTLFESMVHSPYVAPRMQTWGEAGRKAIRHLMAKMGVPKTEFEEVPFRAMSAKVEANLHERLRTHLPSCTSLLFDHLVFPSYEAVCGYDVRYSAADMVHGLAAGLADGHSRASASSEVFWDCYNALKLPDGVEVLERGVEAAKALAAAVCGEGGLAVERRQVKVQLVDKVTLFYYLDITDLNMARASLFRHPFALSQLGHFIREAMLAKEARRRPVVVFGPKDSEGYVTAVGVSPKGKDGAFQANMFGMAFSQALEAGNIPEQVVGFDAAHVRIPYHLIGTFAEELRMLFMQRLSALRQ